MTLLIIGLILFLGIHSTRIFFEPVRVWAINTFGAGSWRAIYTILSVAGLILIVLGFNPAAENASVVWVPPFALLHVSALLTLLAFVFVAAAYLPPGRIKANLRHPMTVGVLVWASAHLLINGMSHEVLLFGSILVWSVLVLFAALRRDRQMSLAFLAGPVRNDLLAIVIGAGVWAVFALYAHEWLFGVAPLV
ncbi:NnrU family protein [Pararhizobium sp. IMCC21322]|uniref:NnrU family protein n=1 Tax=Pararhizobium sp. IMCC21322 TaxID=3067903 RepID=UPI0027406ADD|nr:NnrU family protein [Pararhizobium sp. IMCC21322]